MRIAALTADLRRFRPDFAFGVPHLSHALRCCLPALRDGYRPNLFTDVLDIPTLGLWDHAPIELADQLLTPLPAVPAESRPVAMETMRRQLLHPRLVHWSRDAGQTRIMRGLVLTAPASVIREVTPLPAGFPPPPCPPRPCGIPPVAFFGRLYQDENPQPHPALEALASRTIDAWLAHRERPLWDVLAQEITALDSGLRAELALDPGQTYFWRYARRLIAHRAQTALRLHLLGGAGFPLACYGNLNAGMPGVSVRLRARPAASCWWTASVISSTSLAMPARPSPMTAPTILPPRSTSSWAIRAIAARPAMPSAERMAARYGLPYRKISVIHPLLVRTLPNSRMRTPSMRDGVARRPPRNTDCVSLVPAVRMDAFFPARPFMGALSFSALPAPTELPVHHGSHGAAAEGAAVERRIAAARGRLVDVVGPIHVRC